MKELAFADCWYWFLLAAVVCYLIGCFNFAVIISHFKKKDIRDIGSGNPGTMNMTRTFGLKVGVLNFILDGIKGGLPAVIGWLIFKNYVFAGTAIYENGVIVGGVRVSDFMRYLCGTFVIIGHVFPVFLKFKGGKGIASTMGLFSLSLLCEEWWFVFIAVAFLVIVYYYIYVTNWGSMGSLLGVAGLTIWQAVIFVLRYKTELAACNVWVVLLMLMLLVINILTWARHGKNIYKLLAGEEHRTLSHKKKNKNKT